ncbi:hypothetical protein L7F22_024946 [Adiantum nelumboides]|nr:hypothetical protein [Adiantum nelumboides]
MNIVRADLKDKAETFTQALVNEALVFHLEELENADDGEEEDDQPRTGPSSSGAATKPPPPPIASHSKSPARKESKPKHRDATGTTGAGQLQLSTNLLTYKKKSMVMFPSTNGKEMAANLTDGSLTYVNPWLWEKRQLQLHRLALLHFIPFSFHLRVIKVSASDPQLEFFCELVEYLLNLRLCMAWDSTSFPWEWDAETFHIPGHGVGADIRKSSANTRPLNEIDLCVGKNSPSAPNRTAFSLAKHDGLQVEWHVMNDGLTNGLKKDVELAKGTTASTKYDAPCVVWNASRHNNDVSKEVSLVVHTDGTTSSTKHVALDVHQHGNRQSNGDNREGGPVIYPTSSSRITETNSSWRHVNGLVNSAPESTNSAVLQTGLVGRDAVPCLTTGVLPIVTTCIGIKNGLFAGCTSDVSGSPGGKAILNGVNDAWKKTDYGFSRASEQSAERASSMQRAQHRQVLATKEKTQVSAVKVKEEKGVASTSKDGSTVQIDEQHSSNATGSAGSGDSFTGLHLGKRTYTQDIAKATASKPAQRSVLSSKKSRTVLAIPRCQVEGCKLDLTSAKDYHRRHKVCELHSKAGKVVVAGIEQRFCQQCSRFHLISEFDEAKRSCRRRLAGHNERRRKPQPDPLALHTGLHYTFEDWSILHQSRFSRMPLLWQGSGDYQSNGVWPRTTTDVFDNYSASHYTIQGPAAERQSYPKSLSQSNLSYHDKLSLLLQSPKLVMPSSAAYPRVQQYSMEGLGGLLGDGLTLAPSSTGGGVLPGLDNAPVTRGVTRVSDSGRALSLLSLQTRGSQAPDVSMPDPSGLANIAALNHQFGQHEVIVPQPFFFQGGQQYCEDVSVDKTTVSMSLSNSQPQSCNAHLGSLMTFDKELDDCSFAHDLNRQASNHPLFAVLPYHEDALSQGRQHENAAT